MYRKLGEAHVQAVEQKESSGQQGSKPRDNLYHLRGLNAANQARDRPKDGYRSLALAAVEQTHEAGTSSGDDCHGLPTQAMYSAVHQRDALVEARSIQRVTGGQVVERIHCNVDVLYQSGQTVLAHNCLDRLKLYVRVQALKPPPQGRSLCLPYIF